MIASLLTALTITGAIPPALTTASRVIWLDSHTAAASACEMSQARWRCDNVPESPLGIVVMVGDGELAFECVAACSNNGSSRIRKWGRLLVLSPGGAGPADLHDVQVTPWRPERSAFRIAARRLMAVEDAGVGVTPISGVAFWITGDSADFDSFISIDGPSLGSTRVPVSALREGAPEEPFFVSASIPFSLSGRVQDAARQEVAGANVELFEPLALADKTIATPLADEAPMVLHAETRSDDTGGFTFERLAPGSYLLVVNDRTIGRASVKVTSLIEPVVVRLNPPARARGRVLRHRLPVAGARVHFVPTPAAFMTSTDPGELVAEDTTTDDLGRFALSLPQEISGAIHVIGPDSTSARVPVPKPAASEVVLGDISLPDHRRLTVRLLDPEHCAMSAAGPLGTLGLTLVRATSAGGMHWFDVPEAGEWALGVDCQGVSYDLKPRIVAVPERGPAALVDVLIVR